MARPPSIIRPSKLTTTLPEDVRVRLDLYLFSDIEGRVPAGAYQQFFIERIREFFDTRVLDVGSYLNLPTQATVRGSAATIEQLQSLLRSNHVNVP